MNKLKEIIKDWITDLIGLGIWIIAIVMLVKKQMEFWPEFCGLMVVGGIFFLLPDDFIAQLLKRFLNKKVKE